MRLSLLLSQCVLLFLFAERPVNAQPSPGEIAPDRRSYFDNDDHRRLADLQFLVDAKSGRQLIIRIAATGPTVEPIEGYRGIAGSNRYTAEELGLLLSGDHESKVVTVLSNGDSVNGKIQSGKHGSLPERRLLPSGRIDFLNRTPENYPLEIGIKTRAESSGPRKTFLIIDGQPRLRCDYEIVDGQIRNLKVQSLGGDGILTRNDGKAPPAPGDCPDPVAELVKSFGQLQKTRPKVLTTSATDRYPDRLLASRWKLTSAQAAAAPVSEENWNDRDFEGKWALMTRQIEEWPPKITEWVRFLVQHKEYQLLEWLAIYVPDAFKSHGVGDALGKADAPHWMRVVAWHHSPFANVGHGAPKASQLLLKSKPGHAEHWLFTHQKKCDNWKNSLDGIYSNLKADKIPPQNSARYLPPLQPREVFEHLSPKQPVVDFGNRLKAEQGVVYEHQVVRAINGVVVSGRNNKELLAGARALTKHPSERIRIAALLSFSYFLPTIAATERFDDFVKVVDDSEQSAAVREAALMGLSYHRHPTVRLRLSEIAANPEHVAWNAAVSRIGDTGYEYSVPLLEKLRSRKLTKEQRVLLEDSLKRLSARTASFNGAQGHLVAILIRLAVFAETTKHPQAKEIRDWVVRWGRKTAGKELATLRDSYDFATLQKHMPAWLPEDAEAFESAYELLRAEIVKR